MLQEYFPVIIGYTYQTFATFWVKWTKKIAAFWKLAPRLIGDILNIINFLVLCKNGCLM